jgi:hypothetical protein
MLGTTMAESRVESRKQHSAECHGKPLASTACPSPALLKSARSRLGFGGGEWWQGSNISASLSMRGDGEVFGCPTLRLGVVQKSERRRRASMTVAYGSGT